MATVLLISLTALASTYTDNSSWMTPEQRQRPGASDLVAIGELQSAHGNVGVPHAPSFVAAYRAQHSDDPPPHLRTERAYTVVRVTEVLAATGPVEPGDLIAVATRDAYSWRATPAVYGATVALFLRRVPPSAHTDLPMYRYAPSLETQVFFQKEASEDPRCEHVVQNQYGQSISIVGYDRERHGPLPSEPRSGAVLASDDGSTPPSRWCSGMTWERFLDDVRAEIRAHHPTRVTSTSTDTDG